MAGMDENQNKAPAEMMQQNPYRSPKAKLNAREGKLLPRSGAWYTLAVVATLNGLVVAWCLLLLLAIIVMAPFSDTSRWEMPPYAICASLLIGSLPWLAICVGCIAGMRRIRH